MILDIANNLTKEQIDAVIGILCDQYDFRIDGHDELQYWKVQVTPWGDKAKRQLLNLTGTAWVDAVHEGHGTYSS